MEKKGLIVAALKAVREWAEPAFHELAGRLEALSARIDNLPKAEPTDPAHLDALVKAQVVAAMATIAKGETIEPAQIRAWVKEFVDVRMDGIPTPQNGQDGAPGKDADMDELRALARAVAAEEVRALPAIKGEKGEPGTNGRDGKDAEPLHPDTVRLMVIGCVREVLAEWPRPKDGQDGKSVDLDTLTALIDAKVTTRVSEIPAPQDGAPGKDADISEVKALIDAAKADLRAEIPPPVDLDALKSGDDFGELLDELSEALEHDPIMEASASPINVSVINGGERYHAGAEPLMVADLSARFEELQEKMMWPTVPVYKDGRIVGAKRIPPDQFGSA